jgi:hypothetical protein
MRQSLGILAGIFIVAGTTTACGGVTTGHSPAQTRQPPTDRPYVIDRRPDTPRADCPKQLIVGHVPGHNETVWMIECSSGSDVDPPPAGKDGLTLAPRQHQPEP